MKMERKQTFGLFGIMVEISEPKVHTIKYGIYWNNAMRINGSSLKSVFSGIRSSRCVYEATFNGDCLVVLDRGRS